MKNFIVAAVPVLLLAATPSPQLASSPMPMNTKIPLPCVIYKYKTAEAKSAVNNSGESRTSNPKRMGPVTRKYYDAGQLTVSGCGNITATEEITKTAKPRPTIPPSPTT